MRGPADFVDPAVVLGVVEHEWGVRVDALRYLPVGGGAYHWAAVTDGADRLFVTCDDLATKPWLGSDHDMVFRGLSAVYRAAATLRSDHHLSFVLAPALSATGEAAVRLDDAHSISVLPFVEGRPGAWGQSLGEAVRAELVGVLATLHETPAAELDLPVRTLAVPDRRGLDRALAEVDEPWHTGPLSEAARHALRAGAITVGEWLAALDSAEVHARSLERVVTHGEPHPGNLIVTWGGVALLDWDTLALGHRERDLWMLDQGPGDDVPAYAALAGRRPEPEILDAYRLLWTLTDLAAFTSQLRRPHGDTADTRHALDSIRIILAPSEPAPWGPVTGR